MPQRDGLRLSFWVAVKNGNALSLRTSIFTKPHASAGSEVSVPELGLPALRFFESESQGLGVPCDELLLVRSKPRSPVQHFVNVDQSRFEFRFPAKFHQISRHKKAKAATNSRGPSFPQSPHSLDRIAYGRSVDLLARVPEHLVNLPSQNIETHRKSHAM
jgi:hypothetical protein